MQRNSNRHGAAVVEYDGKRGKVFRIKYRDAAGRQAKETIGAEADGTTRKDAEDALRERLVQVRRGYRRPQRLALSTYANTWLEEGKRKRAWKPKTITAYERSIRRLLERNLGGMYLAQVRPRHVAEHVAQALDEYSPKTVQLDLNVLHNIFKTAEREELVSTNPVANVERPKVRSRRWRLLEPVEVRRVFKAFTDQRAKVVFLTLYLTGIRRFELIALQWKDVDLIDNVLRITDSKSDEGIRSIALSPTLAELLWQLRRSSSYDGDGDFVFAHPARGSRLDADWYKDEFLAALASAKVEGHIRAFHDARHTAITNDAASGANPIAVMAKAGHRSMSTTKTYLHLAGVVFLEAAAALERRMLGDGQTMGTTLYPSDLISDDLSESNGSGTSETDLSESAS
jgi:integrase